MDLKVYLKEETSSEDTVYLHPIKAKRMKINEGAGTLKFGTKTSIVNIIITTDYSENELYISRNVVKNLKIPLFCEFELMNDQQNFKIGPFIGILAAKTERALSRVINSYSNYVYHYEQIGGTIMVFSLNGVSPDEQTITGYIFNPTNKKWEKGIYHYPSALFSRIFWSGSQWQDHFESVMGKTVFNNFHYDKWTTHKLLENSPNLTNHVPKTILYRKPSDILSFFTENSSAYLKPISSMKGEGIMRIDLLGNGTVQVKYHNGREVTQKILYNRRKFNKFFSGRLRTGKYIIQKSIDLVSKNGGILDYRIYLTKDSTKEWQCITTFSRHGNSGEIVSNVNRGGAPGMGLQQLKDILHLSDQEIIEIENVMKTIAIKAVKAIEKSGVHFANTGIDIGIDKNKRVWIIEIQSSVLGQLGFRQDKNLHHDYLNTIMQYAKKLAEF
ncbi:YheC/YheD family protein [Salipaludibacillus sp. CF4.18]|uniref:YheC/YheD family endospore coat-associated protein n=1 Tax=Salipaludibacillus sp. CF4.18 TaxID=3373081 RepID=UPI003EE52564